MTEQEICNRRYIRKSRLIEAVLETLAVTGWTVAASALALYTHDPALAFIAGFGWAMTMVTGCYWCTR